MSAVVTQHIDAIRAALAPIVAPFANGLNGSAFLSLVKNAVPALMQLRAELDITDGSIMHELVVETVVNLQDWARDHDNPHIPNWIEGPLDAVLTTEFVRGLAVAEIEKEIQKARNLLHV